MFDVVLDDNVRIDGRYGNVPVVRYGHRGWIGIARIIDRNDRIRFRFVLRMLPVLYFFGDRETIRIAPNDDSFFRVGRHTLDSSPVLVAFHWKYREQQDVNDRDDSLPWNRERDVLDIL